MRAARYYKKAQSITLLRKKGRGPESMVLRNSGGLTVLKVASSPVVFPVFFHRPLVILNLGHKVLVCVSFSLLYLLIKTFHCLMKSFTIFMKMD